MAYKLNYKELGSRIRAERKHQNLTQEKLAEMTNISESFLGHIERGGRVLSVETLINLANSLGLSVEYIVSGEFNYQPDMLPKEIVESLNKMNSQQRKVFISIMKTLSDNSDSWSV